MRKHDARMIIQRIVAGAFRGTRKAFNAKKLETKRKDHPQRHLYWCKREPINQRRKIEIEFWTGWYLSLHSGYFREKTSNPPGRLAKLIALCDFPHKTIIEHRENRNHYA